MLQHCDQWPWLWLCYCDKQCSCCEPDFPSQYHLPASHTSHVIISFLVIVWWWDEFEFGTMFLTVKECHGSSLFHFTYSLFLQLSSQQLSETTREEKHEKTWLQPEDVFWELGSRKFTLGRPEMGNKMKRERTFNLSEKKTNPDGCAHPSLVRQPRRPG